MPNDEDQSPKSQNAIDRAARAWLRARAYPVELDTVAPGSADVSARRVVRMSEAERNALALRSALTESLARYLPDAWQDW